MITKSDKKYLESQFISREEFNNLDNKVDSLSGKLDRLLEIATNSAGDIRNLQEDMIVLTQHSIENFDENERQNRELEALRVIVSA